MLVYFFVEGLEVVYGMDYYFEVDDLVVVVEVDYVDVF